MLQRQVPDGEGLELGVARLHPVPMLVVELGQAGGHLAAAGAGGGDHHQRTGGADVVVAAEALVADDQRDVGRIVRDAVHAVHVHAQLLHLRLKDFGGGLAGVLGQADAAHVQAEVPEHVHQAHHVGIVGDAQVAALLVLFDVVCVDGDHDFRLILQLQQHADLVVRRKARQHPGRVVIVEQLAAEFQIQLAAELRDALANALGLKLNVLL